jgi:cytochrome c oxidase cbb3-type subunit 2
MHFFHPAQVSGASIMPSFSYLFADNRGNDLVAYLVSLKSADYTEHQEQINDWQPSGRAIAAASPELGRQLYVRDCATCHDADGATRRTWASSFHRLPPNLATGPFHTLEPALPRAQLIAQFARIARFGIAGTDMPGHETLTSEQAASIGLWLAGQFPKPARSNPEPSPEGDHL